MGYPIGIQEDHHFDNHPSEALQLNVNRMFSSPATLSSVADPEGVGAGLAAQNRFAHGNFGLGMGASALNGLMAWY